MMRNDSLGKSHRIGDSVLTLSGEVLLDEVGLPLSLLQRILVTTDGTVTHILEAYAGEQIQVVKLEETHEIDDVEEPELEAPGRRETLRRTILLQGKDTRRNYLYAKSVLLVDRMDPRLSRDLLATDEPIGKLLRQTRMETFREVLEVGNEPAGDRGQYFGVPASSPFISRAYRVIAGGRPAMLITEKFPASVWADGSRRQT